MLKQQYETVVGPTAGTAVYSPLNNWVVSFDDLDVNDNGNNKTLNVYFSGKLGTKFVFNLYRRSTDPSTSNAYVFLSSKTTENRTVFKSPKKVPNIQVYSFNDVDLTPVTSSGQPALRMIFKQLTNEDMNGLANFSGLKKYYVHKDSYPIPGAEIVHTPGNTSEISYIVSMAEEGIGVNGNIYLRVKIFNDELNTLIDGEETSPVVVGQAQSYVTSVTGLNITNTGNNGNITVSWTKQPNQTSVLGAFNNANVQNRVVVVEDGPVSPLPVIDAVVSWSASDQKMDVTGLGLGKTYKVYVIAEGRYTRPNLIGGTNRFDDAIISNNYVSGSIVVAGVPSIPIIDGKFPANEKFTVLYDTPLNLFGISANKLEYLFFMNRENVPYVSPGVLQHPVATSTLTSSTTIIKTFATAASANNISNLIDLSNDTLHKFTMGTRAVLGGFPLLKNTDSRTYLTVVNGSNVNKTLNLVSNSVVPERTIYGLTTNIEDVYPGDSVPEPTGLELTGAQSKITVSFNKTGSPVTDIDITVNNSDGLNSVGQTIPSFNTTNLQYTKAGTTTTYYGIFALEQAFQDNAFNDDNDNNVASYGPSGWNFRRVLINQVTKYFVDFTGLTNGIVLNFEVRNAKKDNNGNIFYSSPTSGMAAAEAPPSNVQSANFSVDSGVINVSWSPPLNSGGANVSGNGDLFYKIQLLSIIGNVLETKTTTSSVLTTQFTGLTNYVTGGSGTEYKVRMLAYYIKQNSQLVEGDFIYPYPRNNSLQYAYPANGNQIRVGLAPQNATGVFNAGDKKITGSITLPSSSMQILYPVTNYQVILKETQAVNQSIISTGAISDITSLANGKQCTVVLRPTVDYKWAQGPDDVEYIVTPYGPLSIDLVEPVPLSNGKNWKVKVNLNGTGSINTIIGLAKTQNDVNIVVKTLSSSNSNLPTITPSGNAEPGLAALQKAEFIIQFPELSGSLRDLLLVVVSQKGSDNLVFPNGTMQLDGSNTSFFQ